MWGRFAVPFKVARQIFDTVNAEERHATLLSEIERWTVTECEGTESD